MKKISVKDAITMDYLLIDMNKPVEGYETYDFRVGQKCKINGFPFQLMYENGEFSLEAECICLTVWKRKESEVAKFKGGQTIAIIALKGDNSEAYEFVLPEKVRQQSIIIK